MIYVASSWRNEIYPEVVEELRGAGLEVYDFRNPGPRDRGFHWSEIDERWKEWDPETYRERLTTHPLAARGFATDRNALDRGTAGVLVLPCERSAHFVAGYFVGAGKPSLILGSLSELELMYKMADSTHDEFRSLLGRLEEIEAGA